MLLVLLQIILASSLQTLGTMDKSNCGGSVFLLFLRNLGSLSVWKKKKKLFYWSSFCHNWLLWKFWCICRVQNSHHLELAHDGSKEPPWPTAYQCSGDPKELSPNSSMFQNSATSLHLKYSMNVPSLSLSAPLILSWSKLSFKQPGILSFKSSSVPTFSELV